MNIKNLPATADPKWLSKHLQAVAINRLPPDSAAAQAANEAHDPATGASVLRGEEISDGLFKQLQKANGETGATVTLMTQPDGKLTPAGLLLQALNDAAVTRDTWFEAKDGTMLGVVTDLDMSHFRDGVQKPVEVTGGQGSMLEVAYVDTNARDYAPLPEFGVLFHETQPNIRRSGNTSANDAAPSFVSDLTAPHGSDVMGRLKAKNLTRDPSTVRRELSATFFRETLQVPTQRIAPVKWYANGGYGGLRDLEEPLDTTMWTSAVQSIDPTRKVPDDVWIFKLQMQDAGITTQGGTRLVGADLRYHNQNGDDGAAQYRVADGAGDQIYDLQTGKKEGDEAYGELAKFVKVVNGIGLRGEDGTPLDGDSTRFNTDAYRKSVESSMDVYEVLRCYTGLVLTGAWDNIITPSNFAWVAEKGKDGVKWSALPIDLDSNWGIHWDGQPQWQDLDVLLRDAPESVPVIWKNLLANDHFKAYVLDFMDHLLDDPSAKDSFADRIGAQAQAIWERREAAAYEESGTATGPTTTSRPFTDDEVYMANFGPANKDDPRYLEYQANPMIADITHSPLTAHSIRNFAEWRHASARWQIDHIRQDFKVQSGVDFSKGLAPTS
jgi:hypothetical protein